MAKIQTVNQLISVFKDIATRHYQINGFGIGDDWENGASEEKMHPVLWINPVTANMPESESTGYKTFEIDFEVRVFDLVSKGESNENDVLSDCIDILKDIILEFKGHPYYVNSQLNIIDDISFEAFTEEFDEDVSGWVCELSLMTPILNSFCGIPAADITGFEFPGIDCPDVNVLCPVFVEDVTGVYPIVVTTVGTTKEVSIVGGVGSDTYVISGVYDTGTLTLTRNDAVDVVVTGFASGGDNDYTTAATLTGNIITFDRTDTVGAYSVDLTSAINSAPDKFVSSGAFDDASKLLTLTLNDASDFDVDFSTLTTADKFVSSGAYDEPNNKIVLTLNDASTVDIDTSAIGGGDSIYTADGTLTGDRIVDLDLKKLTFDVGTFSGSGVDKGLIIDGSDYQITNTNSTNSFLEVFNENGTIFNAMQRGGILSYSDVNSLAFLVDRTNTKGLRLDTNNSRLSTNELIFNNSFSGNQGIYLRGSGTTNDLFFRNSSNQIQHWIRQGDSLAIASFFYSGMNGKGFIVGGSSSISSEKISLQSSTAIKGIGTAGSSALAIYDNDTTPVKLWDFLDNGNVIANQNPNFKGVNASAYKLSFCRPVSATNYGTGFSMDLLNSAGNQVSYGSIFSTIVSGTSGSEYGYVSIYAMKNGTPTVISKFDSVDGLTINDVTSTNLFKAGNVLTVSKTDISLQGDTLLSAKVSMPNLPTSATGLATGDLWNDGGTLKIA